MVLLADRYGRRIPLIVNIVYYSLIEVLSGLAPNYTTFLVLRLLYGIGMGGEWGVGASLTMEAVPVKWRGVLSGFLQEGYALGFLAGRGRIPLCFSALGLAAAVLRRRTAGAAHPFRSGQSDGNGSLETIAHRLG